MYFYLLFFLIINNIIRPSYEESNNSNNSDNFEKIDNSDIIAFNNNFNHIFFYNNYFILYLGTEMVYVKFVFNNSFNNNTINYNPKSQNIQFNFTENITVYNNSSISYLGKKRFLFKASKNFIIHFDYEDNNNINTINYNNESIISYNMKYYEKINNISITLFLSNGENIFVNYYFLSFILIISGCLSILYGAYHFMFGYIIHLTLFLYFYVFELVGIFSDDITLLSASLYLFFCCIFSISCSPILITDKKDNKRYMILKLIYGCSFGYSVFKILSYNYIYFNLEGINNDQARRLVYFAFLTFFVGIGLIFNLFNPFKKYIFLPCSAVSGSYYLTKGLSYIIGGYFSDIIAIKEGLKFDYINNRKEIIATYLIINISIIILSIIFQIKHIENKQTEMKEFLITEELISNDESRMSTVSRLSNVSDTAGTNKKRESEEILLKESLDKEKEEDDEGNEDIEIDDQED